eukprot:scaffold48353_cov23-Prasinocladus_malaysianus.AAC.1
MQIIASAIARPKHSLPPLPKDAILLGVNLAIRWMCPPKPTVLLGEESHSHKHRFLCGIHRYFGTHCEFNGPAGQ